jgi:hypothetical protein
MALVLKDRVKETTTTTGTSTYTLAGAENGFEAFSSIGNGNTTYYCCTDGVDFEVGVGTYTLSGTVLARTAILQSSNSDSAVSWANGTRTIFCTQPAEKAVFLDASGNMPITNSATIGGSLTVTGAIDVTGTSNLDIVDIDGAVDMATTLGVTGNLTLGAQLIMPDVTSAKILVADGTSYQEVAVSGDVTIANTGAVTIGSGVVETGMIAADAITGAKIADNAIDSEHYAADSIDNEHLANDAVGPDELAADAVVTASIVDGNVTTAKIAADAVTGAKIADDTLNSEHYAAGSIDLEHMSANSVDSDQYVDGSIDTAHIANLQITTGLIAADAITGAKIADDAIDSEHYADGSIDTAHIANLQITTGLIAADAITGAKIADDVIDSEHYAAGSIDTEHLADANVTLAKIANQAANTVLVRDANSSGVVSAKAVATTQLLIGNGTGFTAATLSGDVTMTNAGVVTIAATSVEGSMLNTNVISGQTELASGIADTDELLISDAGTIKRTDMSVIKTYIAAADDATALAIALG